MSYHNRGRPTRYDRIQDKRIRANTQVHETKQFVVNDIAKATNITSSIWSAGQLLNSIAQGDSKLLREGALIRMKSMSLRLLIEPNTSNSSQGFVIRIVIVLFQGDTSRPPTFANWAISNTTDALLKRAQEFAVTGNWAPYRILYDRSHKHNTDQETSTHQIYIDLHAAQANYGNDTAAVQPIEGCIALFVSGWGQTQIINVSGVSRLLFQG